MKKLLCIILALTLICALFVGCGKKDEAPAEDPKDNVENNAPADKPADEPEEEPAEQQKILAVFMSLAESNWQGMDGMFREKFTALGYGYDSISGENDPLKQIEQIENGVVQGYDLIIIMPVTGEAVADACQAAMDAGVYIYCFINDSVNHTVYRTVDAAYSGEILAQYSVEEWALKKFPDAADGSINTVMIGYDGDSQGPFRRLQGQAGKLFSGQPDRCPLCGALRH